MSCYFSATVYLFVCLIHIRWDQVATSQIDGQVCIIAGSKQTKDEIAANDESLSLCSAQIVCAASASIAVERVAETSVGHRRDRPAAQDPSFLGERRAVTCRYFVVCWLDRSTSLQISALVHNSLKRICQQNQSKRNIGNQCTYGLLLVILYNKRFLDSPIRGMLFFLAD